MLSLSSCFEFTDAIKVKGTKAQEIRNKVVNLFLGETYSKILRRTDYLRETYRKMEL